MPMPAALSSVAAELAQMWRHINLTRHIFIDFLIKFVRVIAPSIPSILLPLYELEIFV